MNCTYDPSGLEINKFIPIRTPPHTTRYNIIKIQMDHMASAANEESKKISRVKQLNLVFEKLIKMKKVMKYKYCGKEV